MRIDEFLLARIAEDEAVARKVVAERAEVARAPGSEPVVPDFDVWADVDSATMHVAVGAERMIAECEAKRAVVEQHRPDIGYLVVYDHRDREAAEAEGRETMAVIASVPQNPVCLRALAAIYADHPDYRPEWRA